MESARILQLRNHLMRQTEERRAFLIAEGLKLADEDLQMKIEAKAEGKLRPGRPKNNPPENLGFSLDDIGVDGLTMEEASEGALSMDEASVGSLTVDEVWAATIAEAAK